MHSLIIAAVVGLGVRFGHSFGNSLVVVGARNASLSKLLVLIMTSEANKQHSDLLNLGGRCSYKSCPSSFIAATSAAFSASVPIEMRSLSRSRSWSK